MGIIQVNAVQIILFIFGFLLGRFLSNRKHKKTKVNKEIKKMHIMWSGVINDINELFSILRNNREEIIELKRRISDLEDCNSVTEVELIEM